MRRRVGRGRHPAGWVSWWDTRSTARRGARKKPTLSDRNPEVSPGPFQVHLADDGHYLDEAASAPGPSFRRYADALEWCRERVESSLREYWKPGMTAAELFDFYRAAGEDPWVTPVPEGEPHWSAWEYAAETANRICSAAASDPAPSS